MSKGLIFFAILFAIIFFASTKEAHASGKKFIYIPIDTRPVNKHQTVEVAEKLGYEILVPPEEFLGRGASAEKFGEPEKLWQWLEENSAGADAAVISSDAMIYGSLVGSRQHSLSAEEILSRAKKFEDFKKKFPYLPIYLFGTIMRTPKDGMSASAEPEYYAQYGGAIFNYTVLKDKQETEKLSRGERKELSRLENFIPPEALEDWFKRRAKNYDANKFLVDLMKAGTFEYFLLGCDDSAIFSQTHLESRHLKEYGRELGKTQFQVLSGVDELGMLMISRAVNKNLNEIPFVAVEYNDGTGGETIPSYGNEKISDSIDGAIIAAGGMQIPAPERADFVVAVNTNFDGKTFEANSARNILKPRRSTKNFMKILKNFLAAEYPVGVADISFANGADNALMEQMRLEDLQLKLLAYGGWNTASNSSGFLIGAGVLARLMNERDANSLLMTRYLDDWAYQANVRQALANNLWSIEGEGNYSNLGEKLPGVSARATEMISEFAREKIKLPAGSSLKNISVTFPWNRMFESNVSFDFE